jgi:starch synthase
MKPPLPTCGIMPHSWEETIMAENADTPVVVEKKRVLFVGSECYPFIKTGGLADVMGALPKALVADGWDARVIIPKYGCLPQKYKDQMVHVCDFWMDLGGIGNHFVGVERIEQDGVTYYFLDNEGFFSWGSPYTNMYDDIEKFIFFDKAVLAALPVMGWQPDVIHAHDWQAGLVPVFLRTLFYDTDLSRNAKCVITIHNLRFQGICERERMQRIAGLPNEVFALDKCGYQSAANAYRDDGNMLKGGIVYADRVTTVSDTYSHEIQTPEYGEDLDGIMRYHASKMWGIVNGIDYDVNNPATDKFLVQNYDASSVVEGKKANKLALQEELDLARDPDKMVIGLISRLTNQKGLDLVRDVAEAMIGDGNTQFVLLGTGDAEFENMFRDLEWRHHGTASCSIMYSAERSSKIYAAADVMLVPSRFEPCGLTQLIAMRYGALPVVRETGGLRDTVEPYNEFDEAGVGFSFNRYEAGLLLNSINYAKTVYFTRRESWDNMVQRAMTRDFSWNVSAKRYEELYASLA